MYFLYYFYFLFFTFFTFKFQFLVLAFPGNQTYDFGFASTMFELHEGFI